MHKQTYVTCTNYEPSYKSELVYWMYTARTERLFNRANDISVVFSNEIGSQEASLVPTLRPRAWMKSYHET